MQPLPSPGSTFPFLFLPLQRLGRHLLALPGTTEGLTGCLVSIMVPALLTLLPLPVGKQCPGGGRQSPRTLPLREQRGQNVLIRRSTVSDPLFRGDREVRGGKEASKVSPWASMDWGPEVPTPCQVHSCSLSDGWGQAVSPCWASTASLLASPPRLLPPLASALQ